jgi:hypothetical protein
VRTRRPSNSKTFTSPAINSSIGCEVEGSVAGQSCRCPRKTSESRSRRPASTAIGTGAAALACVFRREKLGRHDRLLMQGRGEDGGGELPGTPPPSAHSPGGGCPGGSNTSRAPSGWRERKACACALSPERGGSFSNLISSSKLLIPLHKLKVAKVANLATGNLAKSLISLNRGCQLPATAGGCQLFLATSSRDALIPRHADKPTRQGSRQG